MPTNIDHWETTKLDDFRMRLGDLRHPEYDLEIEEMGAVGNAMAVRITGPAEGFEVIGYMLDGWLHVDKITLHGMFSGRYYYDTFLAALKNSLGLIEFTAVWMGGEVVERLRVKDGVITDLDKKQKSTMERLLELLPSVEHCIVLAEDDTDEYEGYLDTHPGHDNDDERESIAGKKESVTDALLFVRLFKQLEG